LLNPPKFHLDRKVKPLAVPHLQYSFTLTHFYHVLPKNNQGMLVHALIVV